MMIKFADIWERNHIRVANTLAVFMLIFYAVFRYVHLAYLSESERSIQTFFIIASALVLFMLFSILFAKTTDQLAIFLPSILAAGLLFSAIFNNGVPYIFVAFVGTCALCGVYFSTKPFVGFVFGLNLAIFVTKVLLGIDITGSEVSYSASYLMWGIMQLCIAVMYLTIRYISSRHKISRRSMRSYHAMLASTPNLVALVDKENRIYHISDKLAELANIQRLDMVLSRPILDVFDNPDMIEMIAEALDAGAPYENTAAIRLDEDGLHTIHYTITCTSMNVAVGDLTFISISDITSIMNARYEAESASRAKSDFLSNMSHEIRTPLNGILGMAEVMSYDDISSKTLSQLETIKQSGSHLLSIINNLLDFSKIERGKLTITPKYFNFHSLINDVISIITVQIKPTNLQLAVHIDRGIPEELFGDVVRIRQILLNILGNSVKYTYEGYVLLEVMGVMTGEDIMDIAFKVTDTGVGLKQDDIDRLFDEFAQFDLERHRGVEGTGLGLTITLGLVNMMKGRIDVKSVYDEGSVFTVTLPLKFRQLGTVAPVIDRENKNVLIFGVPPLYAKSIIRSLDDLGVRHYTADSEVELYYKLSEGIWNYVFVAPHMGYPVEDMCSRIGELKPRIVLTADSRSIIAKENGFCILIMPAYSLSILNILNYGRTTSPNADIGSKRTMHFIAPDAKVLVVDDIETNLKVAKGLLAVYEMQVDTCTGGLRAIEAAKNTQYDLILMDHMMPGMDGIAAMEAIRGLEGGSRHGYDSIPIVALTANTIVGTMEMLLAKGFDDFLAKPIDMTKLNDILEIWIPQEKKILVEIKEDDQDIAALERALNLEIEDIDVMKGMRMTGGVIAQYLDVLEIFSKDGVQKIEEIKSCLVVGDLKLYTTHVHALKSALANIGDTALSKHAHTLENAGNNQDMGYISKSGNEFIQKLEKLLANIAEFLSAHASKVMDETQTSIDEENIAKGLNNLKTALLNFDLTAIDEAASSLRAAANTDVDSILKQVLIGEYDDAIEEINKILRV